MSIHVWSSFLNTWTLTLLMKISLFTPPKKKKKKEDKKRWWTKREFDAGHILFFASEQNGPSPEVNGLG